MTKTPVTKLVLNQKALASMGLGEKAIYIIEYDMHSPKKIRKDLPPEKKKAQKRMNKIIKNLRNRLIYLLKYHLRATKHLESCWILEEENLDDVVNTIEEFKVEMEDKGLTNVDERIRIIPILTTVEGEVDFAEKRMEWLLEVTMQHVQYLEKALRTKKVPSGTIWKCKTTFEFVSEQADVMKNHKQHKELIDTVEILDELTSKVQRMMEDMKDKE